MSPRARSVVSLVVSLALAVGLLWLALRDADLAAVGAALVDGQWGWAVPFIAVALVSVLVRAWRWGLLVDALPAQRERTPLRLLAASVCIGYLVNYAAPRLGEVARTANVSRRTEATFAGVLGTVVAERLLDVVALGLAILSVGALYGSRVAAIWAEAADGIQAGLDLVGGVWVLVAAALAAAAVAGFVLTRSGGGRLAGLVHTFRDGVATVLRTGRVGSLVASTVALWACYALMADLPLRLLGMDAAYSLSLVDAWAVMAIGGIGMALPAPGGTGSFHYATVQALTLLFGVAATPAATYALLVHAAGVVFYCVLGVASLVAQGASLGELTTAAEPTS